MILYIMLNRTSVQTKRRIGVTFIVSIFLLLFLTAPVAADSHLENNEDALICGSGDAAESTQQVFQFILGIFMVFGFLFAILLWAGEQFENSIGGSGGEYEALGGLDGTEAVKKAFILPFIIYFFDLISEPLFGIDITCIVPTI